MSTADDLLFAPIHPDEPASADASNGGPDFFVRARVPGLSYDWKPVSQRADYWCRKYLTRSYQEGVTKHDGWLLHVSSEPKVPDDNPAPWVKVLITDNYIFEEVAP